MRYCQRSMTTRGWLLSLLVPFVQTIKVPVEDVGSRVVLLQIAAEAQIASPPFEKQPSPIKNVATSDRSREWLLRTRQAKALLAYRLLSVVSLCAASVDPVAVVVGKCAVILFLVMGLFYVYYECVKEDAKHVRKTSEGSFPSSDGSFTAAQLPLRNHGEVASSIHQTSPGGSHGNINAIGQGPRSPGSQGSAESASHNLNRRASQLVPLCKELVMNVDCGFKVPFDGLTNLSEHPIPVISESSRSVLMMAHIRLNSDGHGGFLSMTFGGSPGGSKGRPIGSLESDGVGPMVIRDKRNSTYGSFTSLGSHEDFPEYIVRRGGRDMAKLHCGRGQHLNFTSREDGSTLAHAYLSKAEEGRQEKEHLEVKVNKGVDPVLVLLCMLGALAFG